MLSVKVTPHQICIQPDRLGQWQMHFSIVLDIRTKCEQLMTKNENLHQNSQCEIQLLFSFRNSLNESTRNASHSETHRSLLDLFKKIKQ